ncbi:transposase [Nocardia sp. NPDC051911]|uniref:transposase n=1 Tax=Nocardia sp. NPDC051911 TaxID=3154648 RepID=UPI00342DB16F
MESGLFTKPWLAEVMIGRALAAGVMAGWVTADSAYGRDGRFRAFLQANRMPYVVEVPVRHTITDVDGRRRVDTLISRAPRRSMASCLGRSWSPRGTRIRLRLGRPSGPRRHPGRFRAHPAGPAIPRISPTTCVSTPTPSIAARSLPWPVGGGRSRNASKPPKGNAAVPTWSPRSTSRATATADCPNPIGLACDQRSCGYWR